MNNLRPALGPFFVAKSPTATRNSKVVSTGFAVEWATAAEAKSVELFVHRDAGIFSDQILIHPADCPNDLRFHKYSTFRTGEITYVLFEALLCWLYQQQFALRPRVEVMREISRLVPLRRRLLNEIPASGMLTQAAESRGFLLTAVMPYPSHNVLYADVGWRPYPGHDPLHAGIACFHRNALPNFGPATWKKPDFLGMPLLMFPELEGLAPDPASLFSEAGRVFLTSKLALLNQELNRQKVKGIVAQNAARQNPREKATRTGDPTTSPAPHR
jgi:hypothetical protein